MAKRGRHGKASPSPSSSRRRRRQRLVNKFQFRPSPPLSFLPKSSFLGLLTTSTGEGLFQGIARAEGLFFLGGGERASALTAFLKLERNLRSSSSSFSFFPPPPFVSPRYSFLKGEGGRKGCTVRNPTMISTQKSVNCWVK